MRLKGISVVCRSVSFPLIFFLVCQIPPAAAQVTDSRKNEIRQQWSDLRGVLRPSARQKILQATHELANRIFSSPGGIDVNATGVSAVKGHFPNVTNPDVEATLYLVLLNLYESLQQDLEQQVTGIEESNRAKRNQLSYRDALNGQLALLKDNLKGTQPVSETPARGATAAKPITSSPELTQTRLLGIRYARTPILPPPKDPRRLSASQLEQEIRAVEVALRSLDDVIRLDQRTLDDASQKEQQLIETMDRILKATGDRLKTVAQNLR